MRVGAAGVDGVMEAWPSLPQAVDGSPKRFSLLRKTWPWIKTGIRLLWAWRWPLTFICGPVIVAAVLVGSTTAGLVVSPVAGVVGPWRSSFVRSRFRHAGVRTRQIVWDLYWPLVCSLCGFVELAGRRVRVSGLDLVEFGPGWWWRPTWIRFTVTPCATHDRTTWSRYEDRLRRHLRYGSSTWSTPSDDADTMVITLRRDPLPNLWTLDDINPSTILTPAIPAAGGDRIYFGCGADGRDMVWTPDQPGKAMLFIAGRQGGGKGILAKVLFAQALTAGWRIQVCNPKRVGEFRWLDSSATVAKTPAAMMSLIHAFRVELDRRADVLDETFGADSWTDVPQPLLAEHRMAHRDLLVVDEFVTLMAMKGTVPPLTPPPGAPKGSRPIDPYQVMVGDLQAIAAMGRALGMSLVLLTQHPIAEHMGPFGSTVKANMGAKIGVGSLEAEGAGSLFGKTQGETISQLLRAGIPGRCVYEGLTTTDGGGWKLGQGLYAHTNQLTGLVPAEPVHLPTLTNPDSSGSDGRRAA